MKNTRSYLVILLVSLMMMTSSCAAIEGIFKAGVWTGIILVVVIVALIIWIITRVSKR